MADERDTIGVIAEELGFTLAPLVAAFSLPGALRDFLKDLGWDFGAVPPALNNLKAPAEQVLSLVQGGTIDPRQIPSLLTAIRGAFDAISNLRSAAGLTNDFKNEFPEQLVEYLLAEYFLNRQSKWGHLLKTIGVIRLEDVAAAGGRPAYLRRVFAFQDFSQLFNDPLIFFRNAYRWGQSNFAGEKLLENFDGLLTAWGFQPRLDSLESNTASHLNNGALQPQEAYESALRLIFIEDNIDEAQLSAGVGLFLLPETGSSKPGFALLPFTAGDFAEAINITDRVQLGFTGGMDLTGGIGILVRPDQEIEFLLGLESATPSTVSAKLGIILRLAEPGSPFVLIGSTDASRFELAGVTTTGGTRFYSGGKLEVFTEFALEKGKIVIQPSQDQLDGFLAQLLPTDGMQMNFDLTVGFSSTHGIYFGGSGGLELSLPVHIQLGPIEIQSALVAVHFKDGGVPVDLAATIKADLGILKAVVENIGLTANFKFPPDQKGNLGPVNLDLAFRPPNGIGLSVDAAVIKGGGYLYFDPDRGEYAGALELTFSGIVALKAIGLLSTKMPDGSRGFSLLIIITAEFGTGIQLGFGFTLLAVGGLLGLNRTVRIEPLLEGVRTGAVNSIMFPEDVIANAPRIISDLRTIFPPQNDSFLIGPMAKLGWGTPVLISLSLGIIIEVPGDLTILGVLRVALPADDAALIVLQVNFVGRIEFDKARLYFFAAMFESRVLFSSIEGEMGVLAAFGDDANFVVSAGGFHPRFNPPPLPFPGPRRISLDLANTPTYKLRVEGYFAVTTNTAQFGARAELFFGLDDFNIKGQIGFDALLQFSPLHFIIEIAASLSVSVFGAGLFSVSVRFTLEGPSRWRARGSGEISILFFDFSVDFDVSWGEERDTTLPPITVMPLLTAEFEKIENWRALLPVGNNLLVSLRKLPEAETALVLHPVGVLRVSQRAVPLDLTLDKIGNQKPSDVNRLAVTVAAGGLGKKGDVVEQFAPAQFRDFDDAQKLSQPAYGPEHGGLDLSIAGQQLASSKMVRRIVRYEEIIIDSGFKRFARRFSRFAATLFQFFLAGASVSKSELSQFEKKKLQPFKEKIVVQPETFTVAFQATNKTYAAEAASFASAASADDYLNRQIAKEPNLRNALHVIPEFEKAA